MNKEKDFINFKVASSSAHISNHAMQGTTVFFQRDEI